MISSCNDCKTKCCKIGPGPYVVLRPSEFLEKFEMPENYNTVCKNFNLEQEKCRVWGTYRLPIECRLYVCHLRSYTENELDEIKAIAHANPILWKRTKTKD